MTGTIAREIENKIIQKAVEGLVAAGHLVGLHDGEEMVVQPTSDAAAVMAALHSVDEETLVTTESGGRKRTGWVKLIHGNSAWDVISDYTTNLEAALKGASDLADHYSK